MKKILAIILIAFMVLSLMACGKNEKISDEALVNNKNDQSEDSSITGGTQGKEDSKSKEETSKLIIYSISDDEIEMQLDIKGVNDNTDIMFLSQTGSNVFNPTVRLQLDYYENEVHPCLFVYSEKMEQEYELSKDNGGINYTIDGDILKCYMKHENLMSAFNIIKLWQFGYTSNAISFDGIIVDGTGMNSALANNNSDDNEKKSDNVDNADKLHFIGSIYKAPNGATLQIVHSNNDNCITTVKFDDIVLDFTNAQFMPDYEKGKDAYTGDFDNGLRTFSAFYDKSADSFYVWFTILSDQLWNGNTPTAFDTNRFMETYNIETYGSNHSVSNNQNNYLFYNIVFKHEDFDFTFMLQKPDENGNPTEIVLNGTAPYDDSISFDNETFALEESTITIEFSNAYNVLAKWSAKEQEFNLNMTGDEGWWKMYSPTIISGYYYPEQE